MQIPSSNFPLKAGIQMQSERTIGINKENPILASLSKSAANKKKKRDSLLNTAFDLFTNQGIANTSISNIVEQAGVAKGTFYLYFKDKYDLRDRLIRYKASEILGKAYTALEATALTTLEDKVLFIAGNVISQLSDNRLLLKFISKNLSWGVLKHELVQITPGFEDDVNFVEKIQEAVKASDVKYRNPEVMLYMIVELIGSASYNSILNDEPMPIEKLRPFLMDAIRSMARHLLFSAPIVVFAQIHNKVDISANRSSLIIPSTLLCRSFASVYAS